MSSLVVVFPCSYKLLMKSLSTSVLLVLKLIIFISNFTLSLYSTRQKMIYFSGETKDKLFFVTVLFLVPVVVVLQQSYELGHDMCHVLRGRSRAAATSKVELFVIIVVNGFQPLTIITKRSILDVAAVLDPCLKPILKNISERLLLFVINKEFGILVNDCIIRSQFRIVLCGLV